MLRNCRDAAVTEDLLRSTKTPHRKYRRHSAISRNLMVMCGTVATSEQANVWYLSHGGYHPLVRVTYFGSLRLMDGRAIPILITTGTSRASAPPAGA